MESKLTCRTTHNTVLLEPRVKNGRYLIAILVDNIPIAHIEFPFFWDFVIDVGSELALKETEDHLGVQRRAFQSYIAQLFADYASQKTSLQEVLQDGRVDVVR